MSPPVHAPDEATARLDGAAGMSATGSLMDGAAAIVPSPPDTEAEPADPAPPTTMASGNSGIGNPGGAGSSNGTPPPPPDNRCQPQPLLATIGPTNVLLLVDRSASMQEPVDANVAGGPSRWDAMTAALRAFLDIEQTGMARVGLQFLGLGNGFDDCSIDKYRVPAVEVAPIASNRARLLGTLGATQPGGFKPATPALTGALEYSLQLAQRPENAGIPGVVILFFDGLPSECGTVGPDGMTLVSVRDLTDPLQRFAQPPLDASNQPTQPPIRTFVVGRYNVELLARAGSGQGFEIGAATPAGAPAALYDGIPEALDRVLARPLGCEFTLPVSAPGSSEPLDAERVRVKFRTADGATNELARTAGASACADLPAWYYAGVQAPGRISFCPSACALVGSTDVQLEYGCVPLRTP